MSTTKDADLDRLTQARQCPTARIVAATLTPANVVLALTAYIALKYAPSVLAGIGWWLMAIVLVVVIPYAILHAAVRTGRVDDCQVVRRSQRPWLFAAAGTCVAAAILILAVAGAPRQLIVLIVAMLAGLGAMLALTLVWKASMHLAVAAGAVAVLAIENPPAAAVAFLALPLLAWARVRNGRHSLAQVVVGGLVGAVVAASVYSILRG